MKKRIFLVLLVLGLFAFGASYAFAQTIPDNVPTPDFVDADGDGVCDNLGSRTTGRGYGHQNNSESAGFVDADGDGVCDNLGTMSGAQGQNQQNYVDADGDGTCDHQDGSGTGTGSRSQQHGRGRHNMNQP